MTDWSIYGSSLIYMYLHGKPFLPGSQHHPVAAHSPTDMRIIHEPDPSPWRGDWEIQATLAILTAVSLKVAAADAKGATKLQQSMDQNIAGLIDEYCNTPRGSPFPGPRPIGYAIAAGLSFIAGTLQEGSLRTAVQNASASILEKTAASAG